MVTQAELEEKLGVVDYAPYQAYLDGGKQDKKLFRQFADNVIDTLPRAGSILIKNAPLLPLKNRINTVAKKLFHLPDDVKRRFSFPNSGKNRGYIAYKDKKPQDYKELYHVDRAIYEALQGKNLENVYDVINTDDMRTQLELADLVDDFRQASIEFTQKGNEMGDAMMEVFADYFELGDDYLAKMKQGNSVLRYICYPAFDRELLKDVEDVTRAQGHADVAAVTFLVPSDKPGLWIATKDKVFEKFGTTYVTKKELDQIADEDKIMIPCDADSVFMNIGRPLDILSNGIWPATIHGVVVDNATAHEERFSFPFFKHVGWDIYLNVCKKAIEMRDGVNYYEQKGPYPLTVREYVLDDDKLPLSEQKRPWIEPNKPIPPYVHKPI